jgi:hypothetical protein
MIHMSISEQIQHEIDSLAPAQQKCVLKFVKALRDGLAEQESLAIAQAGAKLAAEVWEPEDFSDWEKPGKANGQE